MHAVRFTVPTLVLLAGAGIAPKSGAQMCALTAEDFTKAGVRGAGKPSANVQDRGASVYCVYAGKSSATGGIELDVFYPAGETQADAKETFATAIAEGGSALKPIAISGADEARWSAEAVSGGPKFATMTVRRGTLVFSLGIPTSAAAQKQLTDLATLVVQRF